MAGIQIADYWPGDDIGFQVVEPTSKAIARANATWAQVAPPWNYERLFPLPIIRAGRDLIPGYTDASLREHVRNLRSHGLKVLFRIQVCCAPPTHEELENVSAAWWDEWFRQYEGFVLYHANLAREEGVDAILLDWSANLTVPANGGPDDYVSRWEGLMGRARKAYSGPFGIDTLAGSPAGSYAEPWMFNEFRPFLHLFDFVGVALWGGLSDNASPTQGLLDLNAEALAEGTLDAVTRATGLPTVVSGAAFPANDGTSINARDVSEPNFAGEFGPESALTLPYDGLEQAMVYQALLKAIAGHPGVIGFYPFHYNWTSLPLGLNYSIRGKAAERVVTEWYGSIPR
jgi:hypothetical protein